MNSSLCQVPAILHNSSSVTRCNGPFPKVKCDSSFCTHQVNRSCGCSGIYMKWVIYLESTLAFQHTPSFTVVLFFYALHFSPSKAYLMNNIQSLVSSCSKSLEGECVVVPGEFQSISTFKPCRMKCRSEGTAFQLYKMSK